MNDPMLARRALLAGAAALAAGPAAAQSDWPSKPIRFIVPFPPGGASDILGRLMAQRLSDVLGQRVVIENRGGANGNIGSEAAAKSPADGYTFLVITSGTHAINVSLYRSMPFDPVRDFDPVVGFATVPNILVVRNGLPVRSVAEFIEHVRARPGQVNYGSIGNGSSQHLAGAQFEMVTGVRMQHVPYRGAPQAIAEMLNETLDCMFQLVPNIVEQVKAGRVRALAVTSARRSSALPEVPTMAEAGVANYETAGWFGLVAPRGTPPAIVQRVARESAAILNSAELQQRLTEIGAEPMPIGPDELRAFIAAEIPRWREIVRASGAQLD